MITNCVNKEKAAKFGTYIKDNTNYVFIYKSLAGILNGVDPWIGDFNFSHVLGNIDESEKIIVSFFLLGERMNIHKLEKAIGEDNLSFLLESGYALQNDNEIEPDNYVLIPNGNKLFVVNPPYKKLKEEKKIPALYVGPDSLKLINFVKKTHGLKVLDLCSGPGTLGISLVEYCSRVDFVELKTDVANALRFNILINGIDLDKVNIIQSDLFSNVKEQYDYILNNPPYVPVPDDEFLPICGAGGEDGLLLVRKIFEDTNSFLRENGRLYMVLESIGNSERPFVVDEMERYFDTGIINVALLNRHVIEAQALTSSKASSEMVHAGQRESELYKKWMDMFNRLKASYIYPTMIEYIKTGEARKINIVRNYEMENRELCYELNPNITIEEFDKKMYRLKNESNKSIVIDQDVRDLLGNGETRDFENIIAKNYMEYFNRLNLLRYLHQQNMIRFI